MTLAIGENVGPYRIVEQLGQGGMASVFKAYHAALDRYVALKVLHPAFLEEPNFLARFQREARVVARLEHPHIVPVYDFADHAGQPFLVMKFIEGETLKAKLGRGPLGKGDGLTIIEAVGEALSYAHRQGVLHRDIKPSNILLTSEGGIFLADFGLARIAEAGESTLSGDMMLGTPQYISPEQARGVRNLDEGTDIYSFGVVLYEVVVGRVPFSADTPFSIIHDHIYTPLPMPRSVNPRVPEAVERVLLKSLAKERGDRFATVDEMVDAFRASVGEGSMAGPVATFYTPGAGPATVRPPSPPAAPEPAPAASQKRPRLGWIAGGLALACLCGFAFLAVARQLPDQTPASAASTGTADATQAAGSTALTEARREVAANPEDPYARIALADALLAEGLRRAGYLELLKAGELFLKAEAYPEAATVLARAIDTSGGPRQAEPAAVEMLTQALFLGAGSAEVPPLIETGRERFPEWEVWPIVGARAALLSGETAQAEEMLQGTQPPALDHPLAMAVLAEIRLAQGKPAEAQSLINRALARPRLSPWLSEHLHELLRKTQPG